MCVYLHQQTLVLSGCRPLLLWQPQRDHVTLLHDIIELKPEPRPLKSRTLCLNELFKSLFKTVKVEKSC